MKYSEFYKLIESAGWTISGGTNHYKYVHPDFDYFIPVGRHPSKEIPTGTLDKMMKSAGLKSKKEQKRELVKVRHSLRGVVLIGH